MTEGWIVWSGDPRDIPADRAVLVDVLYEDDAAYRTLPAGEIDWHRRLNPLALWRVHQVGGEKDWMPDKDSNLD